MTGKRPTGVAPPVAGFASWTLLWRLAMDGIGPASGVACRARFRRRWRVVFQWHESTRGTVGIRLTPSCEITVRDSRRAPTHDSTAPDFTRDSNFRRRRAFQTSNLAYGRNLAPTSKSHVPGHTTDLCARMACMEKRRRALEAENSRRGNIDDGWRRRSKRSPR